MHLQYCTVVLICCTCAVNKNTRRATGTRRDTQHGHKKGTHPRASQGRALRCYERSKHIAPKPRIARAPELVKLISICTKVGTKLQIISVAQSAIKPEFCELGDSYCIGSFVAC